LTYGRTAYTWPTIGHGTFRFRRILVVQTQRMGDVLCATPLITGLRSQFPEAHIGALVQKQNAPVLIGNPHLNEIVAYDAEQMRRSLLSRLRFIGELRNRDYDLCLSIHASNTIGFTLWQSAIPWRICVWRYGAEKRPPWAMMFHQHIRQERHKGTLHEIEHNLNVLRELRMDPGSPTYSVTLHPTELDWSRGFLQERG
jgi:ADP-heptose:LPS heptosyltransferase